MPFPPITYMISIIYWNIGIVGMFLIMALTVDSDLTVGLYLADIVGSYNLV